MRKEIIKKGDKFNRLTAIRFDHRDKRCQLYWLFRCSCGNEKVIRVDSVKGGNVKSCGCLLKEVASKSLIKMNTTHGMSKTREYTSWAGMKDRCLNRNRKYYKDYGGRGITICKRWMRFENFYADMGNRPAGTTLDRIDNNKGYYKENCRWATMKEQGNNKRDNHLLTFDGKTQNISQWADSIRIKHTALRTRIWRGWGIERALTRKIQDVS